jgi:hypothetical protein
VKRVFSWNSKSHNSGPYGDHTVVVGFAGHRQLRLDMLCCMCSRAVAQPHTVTHPVVVTEGHCKFSAEQLLPNCMGRCTCDAYREPVKRLPAGLDPGGSS